MSDTYVLEIHKTSAAFSKPWNPIFEEYRGYFKCSGPKRQMLRLERKMRRKGWRTLVYEKRYSRSSKYRSIYFSHNKPVNGKYRCVYCGKRLHYEDVYVDHIIPVGAAKYGGLARRRLHGNGVNHPDNLVAACERCNARKGDAIGLWPLKASLGKQGIFFHPWRVLSVFALAGASAVILWHKYPAECATIIDKLSQLLDNLR